MSSTIVKGVVCFAPLRSARFGQGEHTGLAEQVVRLLDVEELGILVLGVVCDPSVGGSDEYRELPVEMKKPLIETPTSTTLYAYPRVRNERSEGRFLCVNFNIWGDKEDTLIKVLDHTARSGFGAKALLVFPPKLVIPTPEQVRALLPHLREGNKLTLAVPRERVL